MYSSPCHRGQLCEPPPPGAELPLPVSLSAADHNPLPLDPLFRNKKRCMMVTLTPASEDVLHSVEKSLFFPGQSGRFQYLGQLLKESPLLLIQ